ncbi:hypothetical protein HGRIS_002305 [Hohenbuehelia grisea]|uniref:Uncharacterized protein n=1 Tax=Hohenbuehelia grisea TaxID=104357 RepID=A0ABR3JKA6_9AGAR
MIRIAATRLQLPRHAVFSLAKIPLNGARFRHSGSSWLRSSWATHLAAGAAGGAFVIGSGYAWYHLSGLKQKVETAKAAAAYFQSTKSALQGKGAVSSTVALKYLRSAAKTAFAAVPGSGFLVDRAFDSVDEIVEEHGEEATAITDAAFAEIQDILGDKSLDNIGHATRVLEVISRRMDQLRALSWKAGGKKLGLLLENYPEVRDQLSASLANLQDLAKTKGAGARQIYEDTQDQVRALISSHPDDENSVARARRLVEEKVAALRKKKDASRTTEDKSGRT